MTSARASAATDPAAPGLVYTGVVAGYDGKPVVSASDLVVERGQFVGLVGPNGAGKSTLLRAVTGSAQLLDGSLLLAGASADELAADERARIVGVVPQTPPVLFAFTAREFVGMGRHAHLGRMAVEGSVDRGVVDYAMERTDTLRLADERVDTLSGGDLQRLTLAQALAQEPEVLLLDEATSHLDLNHQLQVLDLVGELAEDGLAVLGVFHDLNLAARYSDRLAVVAEGVLQTIGPPAEVLSAERVRDVFAVRAVVGTDPVTGTASVTPVMREQVVTASRSGRVFVVCGSGSGAGLMRRLALAGYEVVLGALNTGDIDHSVATALGLSVTTLPPFGQMSAEDTAEASVRAADADISVVCDVPFGRANLGNLEAVVAAGRPVVMVEGSFDERDFSGGEAARLLGLLEAAGARVVPSIDEAMHAVAELCGAE